MHPSLKRTVGLAVLGLNPTEVAIGTAFVEGLEEAIDDQPPQRKERILDRFGKIFFSSGSWGDKGRFLAGFGWGFVVGIGKEIWGILRIFYDVPKLMWQANQWFNAKLVQLITGGDQLSQEMAELNKLLSDVTSNVADELKEFIKSPGHALERLDELFGSLVGTAIDKAGEWGHDAVDQMFGFLEDSGYIPRLAIFSDRIFRVMGLNGKAVLPMVLGLGCDTMATMTTRILGTLRSIPYCKPPPPGSPRPGPPAKLKPLVSSFGIASEALSKMLNSSS